MELEKGTYTVLVTPFTKNNYIDFPSLKKIIDNQLNYKTIRGFVILGSTGENSTITDDEKLDIIEFIYKYVNKRKKIILGINNNNTKFCIEMIKKYEEFTDYFMITVPYYNKPSQKGLYTHFKLLSDNTKLPIVLYNIPSRTGINLLPNTIIQLYDTCDNIVAIKESSRNLDQIIKLKRVCNIDIFSGDDELILPILSLGGCGVFSVASSIIPNTISDIVDHCLEDNYKMAQKLFNQHSLFIQNLFIESNPVPIKYVLYRNQLINNPDVRLPLYQLDRENKLLLDNYIFNDTVSN